MAHKNINTLKASESREILVAHGVNLDLLGHREKSIYGELSLKGLNQYMIDQLAALRTIFPQKISLSFFQSNVESQFLEKITERPWAGAIVNAGAWTHTSLALGDRLAAVPYPFMEVHLSNISTREEYRRFSYITPHASGVFYGAGKYSYSSALFALLQILQNI